MNILKRSIFLNFGIVGITFLAYLNAFNGAFQFDDYNVIVNYTPVHSLKDCFSDMLHGIRPLLKLTYALNWTSELGLFGFHFFNISIHAANGILVFHLVRFFSTSLALKNTVTNQNPQIAFIAALFFALHPLQTEAVTYISGRSMSLMTFFYLASLLSYINGRQKAKWLLQYIFSPFLFLMAVATKEIAVTLPVALLLWEICAEKEPLKSIYTKQIVHWVLLTIIGVMVFIKPRYYTFLTFAFSERTLYENILTQINAITYLLSKLFWINRLNIDPDLPVLHKMEFLTFVQLSFLLGVFLYLTLYSKLKPWWRFGALWFVLHLLPTNSIIPRLDIVNDRQMYLALIGVALPLSFEIHHFYASTLTHKIAIKVGVISTLLTFSLFTFMRNQDYYSEITLWEDASHKSPYKARVFNNLGVAYEMAENYEKAHQSYAEALKLDSSYLTAKNNIERMEQHR
jgi:tetratricopeptide (TPR) repeat protein